MNNDDIKRMLSDYQEAEPQGLWDDILAGIDAVQVQKARSAKRRRTVIAIISGVAAAAVIVLGVFLIPGREGIVPTLPTAPANQPGTFASNEPSVELSDTTEVEPESEKHIAPKQNKNKIFKQKAVEESKYRIRVLTKEEVESLAYNEDTTVPAQNQQTDTLKAENTEVRDTADGTRVPPQEISDRPISIYSEEFKAMQEDRFLNTEETVAEVKRKRISVGLIADGIVLPGKQTSGYNHTFDHGTDLYSPATIVMNGLTVDPVSNIEMQNEGENITTRTRYTPPIRSGIMFRWRYKNGFGIETGLQYSYMKSVTESGTADNFSRIDNVCHFVGIPFNLSYSFWDNRYLDVYISTGILMERYMSGSSTTKYFVNGKELGKTLEGDPTSNLYQWSVNASAGIQYNIINWLALFAEPGVTYFMNNKSLYGDQPWNFNIRLGLRFDISPSKSK